jgi:uncharacterized protein YqhQ
MGSDPAESKRNHLYGGQAVIEGVMMRGRHHWALAVRKPDARIHVESHHIDSAALRHPILAKPGIRGIMVLGQSLAIGFRALAASARLASPEEEQLSSRAMGVSMGIAAVVFLSLFIAFPAVLFGWFEERLGTGVLANILEGVFRVALFLGYLVLIGQAKDIRRVFQYHGAEHKTIAAYEHDDSLEPDTVDRYSTLHVRCGTNFLLIVMILTIAVFTFFGSPSIPVRVLSRVIVIPLIAAASYELLRLGARFPASLVMRVVMAPGLWLQRITTKPPDHAQIEVAIASFQEVLRVEAAEARAGAREGGDVPGVVEPEPKPEPEPGRADVPPAASQ